MKILNKICFVLAILLATFGFIPYLYGELNIGGILLLLMALAALAFPFLWQKKGIIHKITAIVYGLGMAVLIAFSGAMLLQAYGKQPPKTGKLTVIVLGAKVVEDRPSRVLIRRLHKAETYLKANPNAICIVTGGQGSDELYPESQVMKNYLVERGIAEERIIEENKAVNTRQNIRLSFDLVPEDSQGIIIVTDNFHQLRASITAETVGMQPIYSLSSMPPPELLPQYWMRDLPGVALTWFEERVLKADKDLFTRQTLGGNA